MQGGKSKSAALPRFQDPQISITWSLGSTLPLDQKPIPGNSRKTQDGVEKLVELST